MVNEVHNDVKKQACRRREDLSSQHEDEVGEGSVGAMEKSRIHDMTFGEICTPSHLHFYYCHKICIHHTHAFYIHPARSSSHASASFPPANTSLAAATSCSAKPADLKSVISVAFDRPGCFPDTKSWKLPVTSAVVSMPASNG